MLYDVICISEIWLHVNITDRPLLNNSKYVIIWCDQVNGGRVAMHERIKTQVSCINVASSSLSYAQVEIVCVDLIGHNYKHRFVAAYRPPHYTSVQSHDLIKCFSNLVNVNYPFSP